MLVLLAYAPVMQHDDEIRQVLCQPISDALLAARRSRLDRRSCSSSQACTLLALLSWRTFSRPSRMSRIPWRMTALVSRPGRGGTRCVHASRTRAGRVPGPLGCV